MSKNELTLENVQIAFDHWRTQGNRRAIPEALRQQAVTLCQQYPISQVVKRLRLNHGQIKAWREVQAASESTNTATAAFVTLTLPESVPFDSKSDAISNVILRHPQGHQLEVTGLKTEQLCALVTTLIQPMVHSS